MARIRRQNRRDNECNTHEEQNNETWSARSSGSHQHDEISLTQELNEFIDSTSSNSDITPQANDQNIHLNSISLTQELNELIESI